MPLLSPAEYRAVLAAEKNGSRAAALQIAASQYYAELSGQRVEENRETDQSGWHGRASFDSSSTGFDVCLDDLGVVNFYLPFAGDGAGLGVNWFRGPPAGQFASAPKDRSIGDWRSANTRDLS